MNAEFNWWLLIVGLVIGAGLVWLVLADSRRRDVDVLERERESEALWIAEALADEGRPIEASSVLAVLRHHATYLAAPPPDAVPDDEPPRRDRWAAVGDRPPMAHPIAHATERPRPDRDPPAAPTGG
ncbi:MAG TPA: hypothetical protein VFK35_04810 [Candidatus Limnocylindrales bacterium]|nr:hypothetical protein [Candidatus Limnocylindrales bacterium]